MVKQKLKLILILSFLLPTIFAWNVPTVTTPLAIDNIIDMDNISDYAVYKLTLINPTNRTFYFYIHDFSVSWRFILDKSSGFIKPNGTEYITVKTRPTKRTSELPELLVIFERENEKYQYKVMFTPSRIYTQEKEVKNKTIGKEEGYINFNISLLTSQLKIGEPFTIFLTIENAFRNPVNTYLEIKSPVLKREYLETLNIKPRKVTISVPLEISEAVLPGNYKIEVKINNITKYITVKVVEGAKNIYTTREGNKYVIINNESRVSEYELKIPISFIDKIFYYFKPAPDYEILSNGEHYYVWKLILLPNEKVEIVKYTNWTNVVIFVLLFTLAILYILLYLLAPKVEVKKEILRINDKNHEIKIMVSISNKSIYKIKDVKIKESLLPIFEPTNKYEFIEPIGSYTKDNKVFIEWFIEELHSKEERILTYTIKYKSEVIGELELDPAVVEFTALGRKYKIRSNKIILKFVKS